MLDTSHSEYKSTNQFIAHDKITDNKSRAMKVEAEIVKMIHT